MTGGKHQVTSRLIKPILPEYSDFSVYTNNYGKTYNPMADEFYKEGRISRRLYWILQDILLKEETTQVNL